MAQYEELAPRFKAAILDWMKNKNPFWALLGMELLEIKKGWAIVRLPISDKLTNAIGMVHGGAIFAAADSAVGMALVGLTQRDENISTLEMKINYMKPVKGREIMAEAKILHRGSRTAVGDVEVRDEAQNIIAKGLGTYAIIKRELPRERKNSVTRTHPHND